MYKYSTYVRRYVSTHSTKSRHRLTRSIQLFPARAEFQYFSATCWHHSFMRTSEWGAASRYSRLAIGRAHAAQRSRLRPASDFDPLPAKLPVAQPHQLTSNNWCVIYLYILTVSTFNPFHSLFILDVLALSMTGVSLIGDNLYDLKLVVIKNARIERLLDFDRIKIIHFSF